jgi:integrase
MIGAHRDPKGGYVMRRDEKPLRRVNPSGKVRFVARYTARTGERLSAGTFEKEGPCKRPADDGSCCAQHRIWWAYEQDVPEVERPATVREYFEGTWLQRHPRLERTATAYRCRVTAVLDVDVEYAPGVTLAFGDIPLMRARPRHLGDLVDVMLREHGRAASGTRAVIAVLSALFGDAIRDDEAEMNPALYVTVRDNDPRVQKAKRKPILASWEQMHDFARAAGRYELMVRVLSDCGLRLGEMLALERQHDRGDFLRVEQSAWRGVVTTGTKQSDGRDVPIPTGLRTLLDAYATPLHGPLFPGPRGNVWSDRMFYRNVWYPAQDASGLGLRPHDMRHGFVSHMRAAGADPADLAKATGQTVQTATNVYTHSTGGTFDLMRRAVG